MKKLLYIGHSYHNKTKSTRFIIDILSKEYEIHEFSYNPYNDTNEAYKKLSEESFDVVVCFQILPPRNIIDKKITYKKGVFFPMYDGCPSMDSPLWKEYKDFLIINFSKTMHLNCLSLGLISRYIQYFPEPVDVKNWGKEDSVFFWNRIEHININTVAELLASSHISHLHLHKALDPGHTFIKLNKKWNIDIAESTWYANKEDMLADIDNSALYIAPRLSEGIGMSFLEAMARGRCVIAACYPTMHEYIKDGINGYLFDPADPQSLIFNNIKKLQTNAHKTISLGYKKWSREKYNILNWINDFDTYPTVSVITATYNIIKENRKKSLIQNINSVQNQNYKGKIEHIIIDGNSNDGTLDLLNRYNEIIDIYSEKDDGIYDAMNKGLFKAQGKYIIFLNSDDYFFDENAVSNSVKHLEANDADFSFGKYRILNKNHLSNERSHSIGTFFIRMPFCHQTMFTKTETMKELCGFNTNLYTSAGDYDFVLRLIMSKKKGVFVDHTIAVFRTGGFSSNSELSERECLHSLYHNILKPKNFTEIDTEVLFYQWTLPYKLYNKIRTLVDKSIAFHMDKEFHNYIINDDIATYMGIYKNSHLSNTDLIEEKSEQLQSIDPHSARKMKRNIFSKYIIHRILSHALFGKQKQKYKDKYTREKSIIKTQTSLSKISVLGVPILKTRHNDYMTAILLFNIPIFTMYKN